MTNYESMDRTSNRQPPSQSHAERSESPRKASAKGPRVLARMPDVSTNETASHSEPSENDRDDWLSGSSMSLPIYGAIGVVLLFLAILPFIWGGGDTDTTDTTVVANEAPPWSSNSEAENSSLGTGIAPMSYSQQGPAPIQAGSEPSNMQSGGFIAETTSWGQPAKTSYQETSRTLQDPSSTAGNVSWPINPQPMQPSQPVNQDPNPWDTDNDRWSQHPNQFGQTENGDTRNTTLGAPVQADYRDATMADMNRTMAMNGPRGELVNSTNYLSDGRQNDSTVLRDSNTNTIPTQDIRTQNYGSLTGYQQMEPVFGDRTPLPRTVSQPGNDTMQPTDPGGYPDYRNSYPNPDYSLTTPDRSQTRPYPESIGSPSMSGPYEQPTAARFDGVIHRPPLRTTYYDNR